MSDLLVFVIDAREAKRNELSSFLEGTKNQVGEIDIKLCLFHFNYCHFEKGPFQQLITVVLNSLCVSLISGWILLIALSLDSVLLILFLVLCESYMFCLKADMLCRTADTGVNSIYAWKGSCLFFRLAFVVGVVSGQSEAQLSFGFVVAVIILSLPQASNSFSVTLCLAGGLVYQTFFSKSDLPSASLCTCMSERVLFMFLPFPQQQICHYLLLSTS